MTRVGQRLQCILCQQDEIEGLPRLHAPRRIDTTDGLDHQFGTDSSGALGRQTCEHLARRHR